MTLTRRLTVQISEHSVILMNTDDYYFYIGFYILNLWNINLFPPSEVVAQFLQGLQPLEVAG
jgi:putative methionine-R-sulfoxide reductase with GAF domain